MRFVDRIAELDRNQLAFAVATVVGRRAPVSSHLGDQALVFPDGRMEGFIGGSCSRDIVRRQALAALTSTEPCTLHVHPVADGPTPSGDSENIFVAMGCTSEGAVDVFIEPHLPPRTLLVAGTTLVADALTRLGAAIGDRVVRVVDQRELPAVAQLDGVATITVGDLAAFLSKLEPEAASRLVAVVASQGHYDESVLEVLLPHPVSFVGLLASRRRASTVLGVLAQQGVSQKDLERVRTPVGLDIGARIPNDVAISILAEIVAVSKDASTQPATAAPAPDAAVDPVCGMTVEIAGAQHTFEHDGRMFYFCCAGCKTSFAADPGAYLVKGL